ncbi:MAG TPA: DNA polymerase/3'-5' exonuclease PolX, partial [Pseudoduganella sp.]
MDRQHVPACVSNAELAAMMRELADLLEIRGENPFRIRAYRNLARSLDTLAPAVQDMLARGEALEGLPGVGHDLAGKMADMVATGSCALLDSLRQSVPPGAHQLLDVPGLGPRKVALLQQALGVDNTAGLVAAARDGRLQHLRGFGGHTVERLLAALATRQGKATRVTRAAAGALAGPLLQWLQAADLGALAQLAGSYRRCRETVGDLDIVARAVRPADLVARLLDYPDVQQVLAHGPTRASVRLRQGLQVDLRVVREESYGAALLYFTGSRGHNIALRRLAQQRGWKFNEYGLFDGARRLAGACEQEVYAALELDFIPPELREERGEIDAARSHALPQLVERAQLRGDLHVHTTASDGRDSLRAMALAAQAQGLSYLAITDHSPGLRIAHGPDPAALARQGREIARLNRELTGIVLLHGAEVDILPDGTLDLPEAVLATLDLVLVAVHSAFGLPRAQQTARILRALDHPACSILAHPNGRLLLQRPGIDADMGRILQHARLRGCAVELNAQPQRLDLDDVWCRAARDQGLMISIASDAHSRFDFADLEYGIGQARRG